MARRRVGFGVEETAPLFTRIPKSEAAKLDRTARALGTSKQRIIASLLAQHLEPFQPGVHEFRPDPTPEVLTLEEAAQLLRVDEKTVRDLAARGELPGRKLGRAWRFSRAALLDWVAGDQAAAAASGTSPRVSPASR